MNKYEILGVVGEGAYGVVLKCKNKENGQILAIKKFKETEDDEIVKKNTQREIRMLRLLKQSNIVELKEAFKRKGRIYLVFEYVEKNLLEVLEESPNGLDPDYIRNILYQLLKAVEHCHNHNIIHRDIKPENLLVNRDSSLKICDFGFARFLPGKDEDPSLTDYVATRWYRAPELLLSYQFYGKPVDMWAIGCIMGELIDGQPLFPGENEIDQLYLIQKMLGPLTPDQKEVFLKNPRYLGMKFPEINKPETLERRYLGKVSKKAMAFMKSLLRMNPAERLSCAEAIQHPYFDEIRDLEKKLKPNGSLSSMSNMPIGNQSSQHQERVSTNTGGDSIEILPDEMGANKNSISKLQDTKKQSLLQVGKSEQHEEDDGTTRNQAAASLREGTQESQTQIKKFQKTQTSQSISNLNTNTHSKQNKAPPLFLTNSKIMQNTLYNYQIQDMEEDNIEEPNRNYQEKLGSTTSKNFLQTTSKKTLLNKTNEKFNFELSGKNIQPSEDKLAMQKKKILMDKNNKTSYQSFGGNYKMKPWNEQQESVMDENYQLKGSTSGTQQFPFLNNRINMQEQKGPAKESRRVAAGSVHKYGGQSIPINKEQTNASHQAKQNSIINDMNLQKLHNLNVIYNSNVYNFNVNSNGKKSSKRKL